MMHARMLLVVMAMALGFIAGPAVTAHAQVQFQPGPTPATGSNGTAVSSCGNYVGLTNRIVMCVRQSVEHAATKFYDPNTGFYKYMRVAVTAFLTLVVFVYGVLALYGMLEKPGRDVMLLMVKISLVTTFVTSSGYLFDKTLQIMDTAAAAVVDFTPTSGEIVQGSDQSQVECIKNMKEAANTSMPTKYGQGPNYAAAWLGLDCVIDTVIGIKVQGSNGIVTGGSATQGLADLAANRKLDDKPGMARGLINFFFSSMQSSIMGVLLAIVGFLFLYSLVWLIVKTLFSYLSAYICIAFLLIFSPLFIPLVLFRVTNEYFKKWLKLLISFALQPVIILAFISFAISAIDLAMFTGDYSVMYRIAGDASRTSGFNLNKYLDDNKIIKKTTAQLAQIKTGTDAPKMNDAAKTMFGQLKTSKCFTGMENVDPKGGDPKALQDAIAACNNSYPVQWWHNSIDWNKMAEKRTAPPVQAAERNPEVKDSNGKVISSGDGADVTEADLKGRTISREVFAAVIFAAVVVLCINGLLSIVPSMVNDLIGEAFQSPNLFAGGKGAGGLSSMVSNAFNRGGGSRGGGR